MSLGCFSKAGGTEIKWYTYQLLVYANYVDILGGSVHTKKKNITSFVFASKEIGLEVNADKTCPSLDIRIQDEVTT